MWVTDDKQNIISMCEGDYGIRLTITVRGATLSDADTLKFTVKRSRNGDVLVEKEFSAVDENSIELEFTAEESARLPVGTYVYVLDWYQNGIFLCNLIPSAVFKVVDKA